MKKEYVSLTLLVLFLISCNQRTETIPPHDHGPEPLSFFQYAKHTELFVEFKPLIAGTTNSFTTHLTLLGDSFTALNKGKVTVALMMGDKVYSQFVDTPATPGIWRLALRPPVSGKGKLIFTVQHTDFEEQFVLENILVFDKAENTGQSENNERGSDDVTYLKEQAWINNFATEAVERLPFYSLIRSSAQIRPAQGDEIQINAPSNGFINYTMPSLVPGSSVRKTESLFRLIGGNLTVSNPDMAFQNAKSRFEKSKADYDRAAALIEDHIIANKEFLQAKSEFEQAKKEYEIISENYKGKGITIDSPRDGYIRTVHVKEGQFVQAGDLLVTVAQNKKLYLEANVSQNYYSLLKTIHAANFRMAGSAKVFSTSEFNGNLLSYSKGIQGEDPFLSVIFELENNGELIPGLVADVFLKAGNSQNQLTVPQSSLLEEQGNFFVFVQTGGESFRKQEIKIGVGDGLRVPVFSGLSEGDRVVSRGAYLIKLASMSGALPAHGHEH